MSDEYHPINIRPGRDIWFKRTKGAATGVYASRKFVALFIHGACAHSRQWREQESFLLSQGLDTIIFDLLGCGHSAKPRQFAAYHPEQLYADVEAVLKSVHQTGEKLIVIGHSFGCALALRLVSSHTDITSGLILLGAYTPTGEKPSIFSLAAWLFYLPDWVLAWMQPSLTEGFLQAAFHPKTRETKPELVDEERQASNKNPPYMFKAFHRQIKDIGSKEDFAIWASEVHQQVLVICGSGDCITPLRRADDAFLSKFRLCQVVSIEESSHQAMQERPAEVNAAILNYIQKL